MLKSICADGGYDGGVGADSDSGDDGGADDDDHHHHDNDDDNGDQRFAIWRP